MVTRGRHATGLQLFVPGNLGFPFPSNAIFHIRPWTRIPVHVLCKRNITTHTSSATGDTTYPSKFFFQPRNQEFSKENGLQIVKIPLKRKGKAIWKDWEKSGTTLISSHQGEPKVPLHSVKYTSLSEASAGLSTQHPIEYYFVWECTRERVLIGDRSGIAMKCDTSKRISRSLHLQAQNEF